MATEGLPRSKFTLDYEQFTGADVPEPIVMSKNIDLYLLYQSVLVRGGYEAVQISRQLIFVSDLMFTL